MSLIACHSSIVTGRIHGERGGASMIDSAGAAHDCKSFAHNVQGTLIRIGMSSWPCMQGILCYFATMLYCMVVILAMNLQGILHCIISIQLLTVVEKNEIIICFTNLTLKELNGPI